MIKNEKKCLDKFNKGFNCSQAVLSSFCEKLGFDEKIALKLSSGFGGGVGGSQNICGAVTGSVMVIGLKYGYNNVEDIINKELTDKKVKEFFQRFQKKHLYLNCKDLLGINLNTEEGLNKAIENNIFETKCNNFVQDACDILKDIL